MRRTNPPFSVRLIFVIGEPWNDKWADRESPDFKENAQDVEAAVQSLYEDGSANEGAMKGIKIIARVVNLQ